MSMFSVVVVGGGMIGSSAAKWVAELSKGREGRVALVGELEPGKPEDGELFGSWFDEGRITRVLDRNDSWRLLAERSVNRYREIEGKSGVLFYEEVGFVSLVDEHFKDREGLEDAVKSILQSGYTCDPVDDSNAKAKFPLLNLPEGLYGYHQPDNSGFLNPRKMVKAQQIIAAAEGCEIINAAVKKITKAEKTFLLTLSNGITIQASKVILATGAYINISQHLQHFFDKEIDIKLTTQTVAYLRISDSEAKRLKDLPTVVTTYKSGALDGTYILPPIKYPDGRFYLKLGHHDNFEGEVKTAEEMLEWYRDSNGDKAAVAELAKFIQHFIIDLKVEEVSGGCCVTSKTPTKDAPYIEEVCSGLFVAAGGCGYAAKSCDEIGRIAAVLVVEGKWDSGVEKERMEVVWRKK